MLKIARKVILIGILLALGLIQMWGQSVKSRIDELAPNVVYVESIPKDPTQSANKNSGFGFFVGERDSVWYIATALHTLMDDGDVDYNPDSLNARHRYVIKIFKEATSLSFTAKLIKSWKEDLAVLEIPALSYPNWKRDCVEFNPQSQSLVSYIGIGSSWESPLQEGKIRSINKGEIVFSIPGVSRGTSGAPLISSKGITGMITQTEGQALNSNALSITSIRELMDRDLPRFFTLKPDLKSMVFVQGGTFKMKNRDAKTEDLKYEHDVSLRSFYLMPTEVSFEEYSAFCADEENHKTLPNDHGWGIGNFPVINVSWWDAIEYCNWRSSKEKLKKVYKFDKDGIVTFDTLSDGYRLPTEAEWEYAARDKGDESIKFGNSSASIEASINFLSKKTQKVLEGGTPNALGFYHLSGNVAEWCWDYYDPKYYKNSPIHNPIGPPHGRTRVVRGGSWKSKEDEIRVYARRHLLENITSPNVGFRLAKNAK